MPRLSLIINTCCGDPLTGQPMYGNRSYRQRAQLLEEKVIPASKMQGWDEIIICGQFHAGDGYEYVPMAPIYRDRRDALWQRELGARSATGDILAFTHDDHAFSLDACDAIRGMHAEAWDIIVPERISAINGAPLNNGKNDDYMGGHSLVMRRSLWAKVPWTYVDTEWWDVSMTRIWREEGGRIVWTDAFRHYDLDM